MGLGREDKLVRFTGVKTVNFLYSASLTVLKTGFINVA
ncbi:hypothetical protein PRUPE_4G055100 [Prunus persica]|uniref:Uncharacterized protein n=1 Tax=Prunus persica TaxID=3760 RepID=A0A251PG70_PRUPE|nr:hypothetical protein PRUPE_4G055100 [Prunus persica]